ncbi:HemK/PrmC family methyltransferase [Schaalia sp. Marseille-Q2122]|uniref:N5-glutamine methyltransferase family protein n=1 Tax=Schaalia sp. Marseille-Q2122 TaxID=2736604 RepID=UPI001588572B|nr:HemK/PrmC family methyltransferase [Schaalia sp. Marseille-Q2122]
MTVTLVGASLPASHEFTVAELVAWGSERLRGCEGANPVTDARTLMEWVCGVDSFVQVPAVIGAHAAERYRSAVARRRHHEPLQHIVGRMWFRFLTLESRPGVFITRPETEMVAQYAIDEAAAIATAIASGEAPARTFAPSAPPGLEVGLCPQGPIVVDLCTGSGAIALALATEVPTSCVYAVELMDEAHALAQANIERIAPGRVHLVKGDATTALPECDGQVDVVVSNPPYVPLADVTQPEALADPPEALYGGGEDGMVIPRGIIHRAAHLLRPSTVDTPGGLLVMEHAEKQSAQLREVALAAGFHDIRTAEDLAGAERMLLARAPFAAPSNPPLAVTTMASATHALEENT